MASQVLYTNLFSESRNNVVDLITTANVPDSEISSVEFRKRIYSREPDVKASDFAGYPFLIVHPADVEFEEGGSVDGKGKFVNWDIEIEIVTSDRGYAKKDGQGLTNMDTISNNLVKTFSDVTNRKTLSTNSMNFSRPSATPVSNEMIENELIYRRSVMIPFRSRIQVST